MPFFKPGNLDPFDQTIRCGIASLGDGLILLAAYSLAAIKGGRAWFRRGARISYAIYFGFGLVIAIAVEIMATSLPSGSLLSWRYSDLMPHDPLTGMALIPIARFSRSYGG